MPRRTKSIEIEGVNAQPIIGRTKSKPPAKTKPPTKSTKPAKTKSIKTPKPTPSAPKRSSADRKSSTPMASVRQAIAKSSQEHSSNAITSKGTVGVNLRDGGEKRSAASAARGTTQTTTTSQIIYDKTKVHRDIQFKYDSITQLFDIVGLRVVSPEDKLACSRDLKLFCETYFPEKVSLRNADDEPEICWSSDQLICIERIGRCCLEGGNFCLAMPRGGGKTTLCQLGMIWALLYGHQKFVYYIGANHNKVLSDVMPIVQMALHSKKVVEDFPEVCYSFFRLKGSNMGARTQLWRNAPTRVNMGSDEIIFPAMLFSLNEARELSCDGKAIEYFPVDKETEARATADPDSHNTHYLANAAANLRTVGINGAIRGGLTGHPISGENVRPTMFLADDVQKDEVGKNPTTVKKVIDKFDGTISGLSGPDNLIAGIMPCTVIFENDVSSHYLNKAEYQGLRTSMVTSWPQGITNDEIDPTEPAGALWTEYAELHRISNTTHGDIRMATAHYAANREAMDAGFEVSWPERFVKRKRFAYNIELSAQQHAMNLRIRNPETFIYEYQNRTPTADASGLVVVTSEFMQSKKTHRRFCCPLDTEVITSFIDVQDEMLYYTTYGWSRNMSGYLLDFGTLPDVSWTYFSKQGIRKLQGLSRLFYETYPDELAKRTDPKVGAPLDARIYLATQFLIKKLLGTQYTRTDGANIPHTAVGIDVQWAQVSRTINKAILALDPTLHKSVIPCRGIGITAARLPMMEWVPKQGELHGNNWIYKSGKDEVRYLLIDTNFWKSSLHVGWANPPGQDGSISCFQEDNIKLQMFCDQISKSEVPVLVSANGRKVWQWTPQPVLENEYFDCSVGCIVLADMAGCSRPDSPNKKPEIPAPIQSVDLAAAVQTSQPQ